MPVLRTGELARVAEANVETLRFYERKGLLPEPPRRGSYRAYPPEMVDRLRFIKRAQELGFSLAEIKELVHDLTNLKQPRPILRGQNHPVAGQLGAQQFHLEQEQLDLPINSVISQIGTIVSASIVVDRKYRKDNGPIFWPTSKTTPNTSFPAVSRPHNPQASVRTGERYTILSRALFEHKVRNGFGPL